MMLDVREQRLTDLANTVLKHPTHGSTIGDLEKELGLERAEVLQAFADYNLRPHTNEIYASHANRVVLHVHNLIQGSWHQERQAMMLKLVRGHMFKTAADVGFGVPSRYVREEILAKRRSRLTLVDVHDSAFEFAQALLGQWDQSWRDVIDFKREDMNSHEYVVDFDVYIFQDSVEHVTDPTAYVSQIVSRAPCHAHFLISLPIGSKTPDHHIAWETNEDAKDWLAA